MKPERIIKTGKSGQEIIKILEAGIEERNIAISNNAILTRKLSEAVERHAETIIAKQKHIVALEKEVKLLKAQKSWRAAVYAKISGIGRKYDIANGKD
jgi:diaminopimelate decarboxylase